MTTLTRLGKLFSIKNLQKIMPQVYSALPYYFYPKFAFPPIHAYFEVTYRCNLRCDMCHFLEIIEETESGRKYNQELTADQIKTAIASLPRFTVITFTGGEAFMKQDFWEILEFAAKRNKVHVITNGTTLTEATVDRIFQNRSTAIWRPGLFFIGVSLEGSEKLHDAITTQQGSYRKSTQGLERIIRKRRETGGRYPMVHVTCVIGKNNVMDLVPLYEYTESLGVDVYNLVLSNPATYWHGKDYEQEDQLMNPAPPVEEIDPHILQSELEKLSTLGERFKTQLRFSPNGITNDEIVRYYRNESSYQDYRCFSPWAKVGVSAYGDVFSCPHFRKGNILENGGDIRWNGDPRYEEFRNRVKQEKIFPGCLGCCQSEYIGQTTVPVDANVAKIDLNKVPGLTTAGAGPKEACGLSRSPQTVEP